MLQAPIAFDCTLQDEPQYLLSLVWGELERLLPEGNRVAMVSTPVEQTVLGAGASERSLARSEQPVALAAVGCKPE